MENEIDLREYLLILRKKMWVIIATGLVFGLISGLISFYNSKSTYEASTSIIISKVYTKKEKKAGLNNTENLTATYGEILKSKSVLDTIIKESNLKIKYEDLLNSITITPVENTQITQVLVQNENSEIATKVCNEIPAIFKDEAKRILKANVSVTVIDKATTPKEIVQTNIKMNIAIAVVLGVMVSVFAVFLIEALDTRIKDAKEVEEKLGIPVVGRIPKY